MGLELTVMLVSSIAGLLGLIKGVYTWLQRNNQVTITVQLDSGRKYEINTSQVSKEDIEKLLLRLTEPSETKSTPASKETGSVLAEVLLLIIPGLIALMLAGTFIYLLIVNQVTPNYSTPKELGAAMTTIMGYYFGLGASAAANKGQVLSPEEVRALIKGKG